MYSEEFQSQSKSNENTFWNWFLVLVAILIVWYIFFKGKENFSNSTKSKAKAKFESESESRTRSESDAESANRKMKIIHKINNVSNAMGDNQYTDYAQVPDTQLSQYGMDPLSSGSGTKSDKSDKLNNADKTADGSTKWMNQVGFLDGEKVACNMLGVNSAAMDDYKKKFYTMYAHQIECPAKCGMKADGMSKGCGMGTKCGLGPNCANVNSQTSIPDAFALNYLALDNANKKSCVSCNYKPTGNKLNREWMEEVSPSYDGLPEDVKIADEARLKKSNLIDANTSNYANFKDNVYQDSIGESAPDRINEIRTCQDAYGTCKLSDYGNSISQAYDKLMANPAYTSRNNCDPYQLSGVLEDAASTDMYANV